MNIFGAVAIVLGVIACFAIKDTVGSVNFDVLGLILIMGGLVAMLAGIVALGRRRSVTYPSVGAQHSWNTTGRPPNVGRRPGGCCTARLVVADRHHDRAICCAAPHDPCRWAG
jgi:hypothetical protein